MGYGALFAGLAGLGLLAGRCLNSAVLRFVASMVPVVVRHRLRDIFIGEFGRAAKMQDVVFD